MNAVNRQLIETMRCTAQYGLLILLTLLLLLHVLVLLKVIPYNIVWGNRLKSDNDMYRFEIFSLLITTIFLIIIMKHAGFIKIDIPGTIITYALWAMTGLFLVNTIGNSISTNKIERLLLTPITVLLTLLSLVLALSN